MLVKEIEIPRRLLQAPERAELVIFAGAGVSMPAPSNYPNFDDLASYVGEGSPLTRDPSERVEHYLGRLHSARVAVHERVVQRLTDRNSRPSPLHEALVALFPAGGAVRIVTTNFDGHFTTAIAQRFPTDQPPHYRAPALPVGSRLKGLAYLHGFVEGAPSDLVLTDADFGRAYLTEGWARRFLLDLFSADGYVVLFVGYSADDPPVQYLTRALPVEGAERRFALTTEDRASYWSHQGITPVSYSRRATGPDPHGALLETLAEWAHYAHAGALGHEARIREILTRRPPLDLGLESYLRESLADETRRRFFVQHAGTEWLGWAQDQALLPILQPNTDPLDQGRGELSRWCALQVCRDPQFLLDLLARSRKTVIDPHFWGDLAWALTRSGTPMPGPTRAAVVAILIQSAPAGDHRGLWLRVLEHTDVDEAPDLAFALMEEILKPRIEMTSYSGDAARLSLSAEDSFRQEFVRVAQPRLARVTAIAPGFLALLENHLRVARALVKGAQSPGSDIRVLSRGRSAIEPHGQNFDWSPLGVLIDAMRETLSSLLRTQPAFARAIIERWAGDVEDQLFVRLAINGVREDGSRPADERLRWLIDQGFLYRYGLKHEVFQLLAATYHSCTEETRRALLDVVESGDPDFNSGDDPEVELTHRYETYNVLVWLNDIAPSCALARDYLARMQGRFPSFERRPYPDLDSWVGPVSSVPRSAPEDWARLAPADVARQGLPWGDSEGLAAAVARDPDWSWRVADELKRNGAWQSALWGGLLRGWGKSLTGDVTWARALEFLNDHITDLGAHLGSMADLLLSAVESDPKAITTACRRSALALGGSTVELALSREEPPALGGDDLLGQAINHPVGRVAEFWVRMAKDVDESGEHPALAADVAAEVEHALGSRSQSARYGIAVLASQLQYLYSLDPDWAKRILLPLLDWSRDASLAEAAWHGFLTWGRWTRELLPHLLPYYRSTTERLGTLPDQHRGAFTRHVAGIFVYAMPVGEDLLRAFLSSADAELRTAFAHAIRHILADLENAERARIWRDLLDHYWELRQQGIPRYLEAGELGAMLDWVPDLEPVFDSVVERVCHGQPVAGEHGMIFYRLAEEDLASKHAEALCRLLGHVLSAATRPFYACSYVERLIRSLHAAGVRAERLRALCEAIAALGCDSGGLWREIERTGA